MKPSPKIPRHIAIIMDGNGRWANERSLPRTRGHEEGALRVDEIVTECCNLGVEFLTLYTFSTENWLRPIREVNMLMKLLVSHLQSMDKKLKKNRITLSAQGTLSRLPFFVRKELNRVIEYTADPKPKMQLSLALSYGGRQEILDAVKKIAQQVKEGELRVGAINEELFQKNLYHPHFPDPDLLIRTGGESRISNFLLWQNAYSEVYVARELWPDFREENLREAIENYASRNRRFGKTQSQVDRSKKSRSKEMNL